MPKIYLLCKALLSESAVAFLTIVFAFSSIVAWALPYSLRYRWITLWSKYVIAIEHYFWNITVNIKGLENIPNYPCILIANHQSMWETLYFQKLFTYQTWVLKQELLWIPFFGWGLKLLEPIAIDRNKNFGIRNISTMVADRLEKNRWVVIFPEGTRCPPGQPKRFSKSAAFTATQINAPILLVKHDAGKCWPKGAFIKKGGTITVTISEPLLPPYTSTNDLHHQILEWFQSTD